MNNNRLMDSSATEDISGIVYIPDPRKMREAFVKRHFNVLATVREVVNDPVAQATGHEAGYPLRACVDQP